MSTPFYDLASLVVVPSGYKASKVYAQKPLTTDGQLTFSRASTATRVNSAGLIETVSSNVPRLDYLGSTCPKLLLEPQRTNLLTNSQDFSTGYFATDVTVTTNTTASPDGTTTADTITEGVQNNLHRVGQNFSATSGTSYTASIFCKAGNGTRNLAILFGCGFGEQEVVFNVNNGTIVFSSGATGTITNYGNGWYRCTATATSDSTTNTCAQFQLRSGTVQYYTGNGTSSLILWGAQVEAGAYPTSYIPTTTAAVTRSYDAGSKTGISSLIGQTEGTIFWELDVKIPTATGLEAIVNIDNGSFGNTMYIYHSSAAAIVAEMYVSGTNQATFIKGSITAGVYKCALAYANNNTAFFVNGVQVGSTDTSCSVPATSRIQMGATALSNDTSWTKQLLLFKTRLTNAQLAELTAL